MRHIFEIQLAALLFKACLRQHFLAAIKFDPANRRDVCSSNSQGVG